MKLLTPRRGNRNTRTCGWHIPKYSKNPYLTCLVWKKRTEYWYLHTQLVVFSFWLCLYVCRGYRNTFVVWFEGAIMSPYLSHGLIAATNASIAVAYSCIGVLTTRVFNIYTYVYLWIFFKFYSFTLRTKTDWWL